MPAIGPQAAISTTETGFTIDTDAGLVSLQFAGLSVMVREALHEEAVILERRVVARAKELAATLDRVRTGAYVASIRGTVTDDPNGVMAHVFSGAPQANILEYGGELPAHDITPSAAQALHFAAFLGGNVFAARIHFPGATIKPRPVLHQALQELSIEILVGLVDAGAGKIDSIVY